MNHFWAYVHYNMWDLLEIKYKQPEYVHNILHGNMFKSVVKNIFLLIASIN